MGALQHEIWLVFTRQSKKECCPRKVIRMIASLFIFSNHMIHAKNPKTQIEALVGRPFAY
jgi:hypothetical protein